MDGLRHPPTLGQAHMVMSTTWVQRQDASRLKQRVPLTERTSTDSHYQINRNDLILLRVETKARL